jgi:hypothetical protein
MKTYPPRCQALEVRQEAGRAARVGFPHEDSLERLAYKSGTLEPSCGTGFPARPCRPFPHPLDSLERLSYNPPRTA